MLACMFSLQAWANTVGVAVSCTKSARENNDIYEKWFFPMLESVCGVCVCVYVRVFVCCQPQLQQIVYLQLLLYG